MFRTCLGAVLGISLVGRALDAQCRPSVLTTYHSLTGHTRTMAEAVAAGAHSVDSVTVLIRPIDSTTTEHLLEADAILVGSPVYNANVAPPVLAFMNRWPFLEGEMRDKVGAAFVTAGGISAGEEAALLGILRAMLIQGMVIVGGHDWWSAFGASAITEEEPFMQPGDEVAAQFLEKARGLGRRTASIAQRLTCPR